MSSWKNYGADVQRDTKIEKKCAKCARDIVVYKYKTPQGPEGKFQWGVFDSVKSGPDPKGAAWDGEENFKYKIFHLHYPYCFKEGFRFNFGDKILYKNMNSEKEIPYEVIGVDKANCQYLIQDIKDTENVCKAPVFIVDRKAMPLNEAMELLFT